MQSNPSPATLTFGPRGGLIGHRVSNPSGDRVARNVTMPSLMTHVLPARRKTAVGPSLKYKHETSSTLASICLLIGLTYTAEAAELPLARVVLSSSGLAQFTHSGSITGGSTIDLTVRLDQVDDLLKSLVI